MRLGLAGAGEFWEPLRTSHVQRAADVRDAAQDSSPRPRARRALGRTQPAAVQATPHKEFRDVSDPHRKEDRH
jgi:hypothetical protein